MKKFSFSWFWAAKFSNNRQNTSDMLRRSARNLIWCETKQNLARVIYISTYFGSGWICAHLSMVRKEISHDQSTKRVGLDFSRELQDCVHHSCFVSASQDLLEFGPKCWVCFGRIEMPPENKSKIDLKIRKQDYFCLPFTISAFVLDHDVSTPEDIVAVFVDSTPMPASFPIIKFAERKHFVQFHEFFNCYKIIYFSLVFNAFQRPLEAGRLQ